MSDAFRSLMSGKASLADRAAIAVDAVTLCCGVLGVLTAGWVVLQPAPPSQARLAAAVFLLTAALGCVIKVWSVVRAPETEAEARRDLPL